MVQHTVLYYPFTSFQNRELLRQCLLYYDKVYFIDPVMAGVTEPQRAPTEVPQELLESDFGREVLSLQQEGVLDFVDPREVIAENEASLVSNILQDVQAEDFQTLLAQDYPEHQDTTWELSVMKIPGRREDYEQALLDARSRRLNLNLVNLAETYAGLNAAAGDPTFREAPASRLDRMYEVQSHTHEEVRFLETSSLHGEYRLVPTSFAVGEAIMINQALHAAYFVDERKQERATPITDDRVHHDFLMLKYRRAARTGLLKTILKDYRYLKSTAIDLATQELIREDVVRLNDVPLDEVLDFKTKHADELQALRDRFAGWQEEVEVELWDDKFARKALDQADRCRRDLRDLQAQLTDWRKDLFSRGLIAAALASPLPLLTVALPAIPTAVALAAGAGLATLHTVLEARKARADLRRNGVAYLLDAQTLARG
ncbi:MAG: hypothetical protein ACE5LU_09345 [Anaerolineae bacterium]